MGQSKGRHEMKTKRMLAFFPFCLIKGQSEGNCLISRDQSCFPHYSLISFQYPVLNLVMI